MKSVLIRCHLGLWRAVIEPVSRRSTRRAIQSTKHKFTAGAWSLLLLWGCAAGADSDYTLIDNTSGTAITNPPLTGAPEGGTVAINGVTTYATYAGAVNVTASSYGNSVSYTPEDQAYSAIDNNFDTAWITGTFVPDPKGQWWQSRFANPVTTDHITLVQPQRGDRSRWVSKVTLTFDGKDPVTYALNSSSHVTAGQTLSFPSRTFHTVRVTIDVDPYSFL